MFGDRREDREVPFNWWAHCCGGKIAGKFFSDPTAAEKLRFKRDVKIYRCHQLIVTLIAKQRKQWEETLFECGFVITHHWKNPNTGRIITLYVRQRNEPRRRKVKALQ